MPKFFVPRENIGEEKIRISGGDVQHIARVLRMNPNDRLTLCDGRGIDYETAIEEISDKEIICTILSLGFQLTCQTCDTLCQTL